MRPSHPQGATSRQSQLGRSRNPKNGRRISVRLRRDRRLRAARRPCPWRIRGRGSPRSCASNRSTTRIGRSLIAQDRLGAGRAARDLAGLEPDGRGQDGQRRIEARSMELQAVLEAARAQRPPARGDRVPSVLSEAKAGSLGLSRRAAGNREPAAPDPAARLVRRAEARMAEPAAAAKAAAEI